MPANQSIKISVVDEEDDGSEATPAKPAKAESKAVKPEKPVKAKKSAVKKIVKAPTKKKTTATVKKTKTKVVEENEPQPEIKVVSTQAPVITPKVTETIKKTEPIAQSAVAAAALSASATPTVVSAKAAVTDIQDAGGAVKETVASLLKEEEDKSKAESEEEVAKKVSFKHSVKTYKKIAFSFVGLTVILLAVVAYFTLVKVKIILIPNQERVSNNLIFDVYNQENNSSIPESAVSGVVKSVEVSETKNYPATGSKVIGEDVSGKVTIINNYNKNQPLVATTRLLTPDGKLFRIKDTVNVPAGGSVEAEIYADQPSKDMAVGPTKFTLPGLWAGLQSQIYAESQTEIKYDERVKKHVTQEDIDNAMRDMRQQLLLKAKTQINEQYKDYSQILYKIDENSVENKVDAAVNDEKEEFSVTMQSDVVVVAFNEDKSAKLAEQKFISTLSENKTLLDFSKDNITYALNNADEKQGTANVTATFEGKISLKENSQIVEVDKILGLNSQQLNTYLSGLSDIAGFEVKYYPSFIKRVPRLTDRITIEIRK